MSKVLKIGPNGAPKQTELTSVDTSITITESTNSIDLAITAPPTNSFETIVTDTGTSPVADSTTDTLNLVGSMGISTEGDASTDTVTVKFDDYNEFLNIMSTGLIDGGVLSINADPSKFNVSAGSGMVMDNHTDPTNPVHYDVSWNAFTAQTVINLATENTTNICIDNAGNIVQLTGQLTNEQSRDYIFLGRLVHTNHTSITSVLPFPRVLFNATLDADDLALAIGTVNVDGNIFGPNGANLNINKSAGHTYRVGTNYYNSKKNPNVTTDAAMTPVTFASQYRNGVGGFTTTATTTTIDPNYWDDGTGTLNALTANKWTIKRIYYSAVSGTTFIVYGQAFYNNKDDALSAVATELVSVSPALTDTALRGWIVIKKGTTALNDSASCAFVPASKFGEPLSISGSGILGEMVINQVSSDPVSPSPENVWVRYTAPVGAGAPLGLLLTLTNPGTPAVYELSYRTQENTTVRVTMT